MFPELSQGTLRGYQVVSSVTAPNDKVWLVDTANFVLAMDPPEFMESTEATVHMEQSQADVLPIVDGTAADPVRSFYQTYTRGIRMVLFTDWAELRSGSVQQIDNVAW
jgi:hypothetical protein